MVLERESTMSSNSSSLSNDACGVSKKTKREGRSVLEFATVEDVEQALREQQQQSETSHWLLPASSLRSHSDSYRPQDAKTEAKRLAVLKEYLILETGVELPFDKVAEKVATRFGVSWAMISLVDMGRLWFKSLHQKDLGVSETPREYAFCAHAIQQEDDSAVFEVCHARSDDRFSQYSLVQNPPGVQYYAGVPLTVPEGVCVGTLCLMDRHPRPQGLTSAERQELQTIAVQVVDVLVKRKNALQGFHRRKAPKSPIRNTPVVAPAISPRSSSSKHTINLPQGEKQDEGNKMEKGKDRQVQSVAEAKKSKSERESSSSSAELIPRPMHSVILPDPKTEGVDPDTYLSQLVQAMYGTKLVLRTALELGHFFPQITDEQMNAYSMEVVSVARANNTQGLQEILDKRGREALDCFNRFGEGLLNLCCRRGFTQSVTFLLSDPVRLSVRVRDDYGRTPLHDACWNPEPQLEICEYVIEQDPSLFFVTDKRGYTPFQYARNTDWPLWRQFLLDRRHLLAPLSQPEIRNHFTKRDDEL